jgi:hypothetical protein
MGYVIGTDEAGYGPNLGPLIVSATVWWVPDDAPTDDLYRLLRKVVTRRLPRSGVKSGKRVVMADSKTLYQPAAGLGLLELGMLAALGLMNVRPTRWQELWQHLCPQAFAALSAVPWYADYDADVPLAADRDDLDQLIPKVQAGMSSVGVRLVAIHSCAVFPDVWNQSLVDHGNKATVLSHATIELLCRVLATLEDGPVSVICDKHGGRNRYGALLQQHVVDWLVEVYREEAEASIYRWGPEQRRVEAAFRPRSERYLPAALASMASKYLRELAMRPFNEYWCRRVPDLRPTAGYPQDARRFKAEIFAAQSALGITDRVLWRER